MKTRRSGAPLRPSSHGQRQNPSPFLSNFPSPKLEEERSLSLLLSILVENALEASEKQKKDRRQLTIAGKMEGNTLLFLIRNRFDEEVPLGENGLPLPSGEGQGLGMRALSAFLSHYDAQVLWKQEAGRVNVFLKCRVEES